MASQKSKVQLTPSTENIYGIYDGRVNSEIGYFIADFKKIEVRPLYKKDGRTDKSNYPRVVPNNRPSHLIINFLKFSKPSPNFISTPLPLPLLLIS